VELDDRTSLGSVKYNTCLHRLHTNASAIETLADRASTLTSAVPTCCDQNLSNKLLFKGKITGIHRYRR